MEINSLTAETILEDEVFCEVMEEEDEIYKARLLLTLTDRAVALGVKTKFETMLKAYKKAKAKYDKENAVSPDRQQSLDRMTEFGSLQHPEMRCGNWVADENGIRTFGPFGEMLACYHPVMPVQRMMNAETGKEKIKLAYKKGNKWKDIIVDKGVIASSNKIVGLADYGVSVTSENARNLVRYLSDIENYNVEEIPTVVSTSKLGWIGDEFMPYGLDIVFDSEMKFKDTYESIHEHGSEDEWIDLVRKIRKSDRFEPKISLVGSLASVLIEPLNALPFILNLWGTTGKGKSVVMMLAASIWAHPGEGKYIADPKSTPTALELRLDFLNHMPLMIDDLAQTKAKCQGDFSELVYMLCSGKGKDRANAGLGLNKSTSWRNSILTNAEQSLVTETMQGGAVNRIIDVEMAEGYVFPNGNEVVEILKQNYGHCGRRFIDLINEVGIERIKEIQRDFLHRINEKAKADGAEKEEKQSLPMSILLATDMIATDYIFKDGEYLDFDTCVNLLKNKGEVSEEERAYDFIMSEMSINISKFQPDVRGEYKNDVWGFIENGYVTMQKNILSKMARDGGFTVKSFLTWADRNGLLDAAKNRKDKQKTVNGVFGWCYCLKLPERDGFETVNDGEKLPFE